ncbi:ribonuclease P protein component [Candidatus Falkowbacteria bacterium]|jgi:ribonuclease P protein component|nr:ribonuclease P protein component [Candidatus Falkowbacteria bacterium]MBT4432866.1 ribonuclease P protein component [Candidatus Falkowbacteria bacterium]
MLPKNNRLTHRKDFDNAFKVGQSFFSEVLGVKATENNLPDSRFGIVVSTKISKKAVARNKIKRQIREVIHKNLDKIKKGLDVVIICRPGIEKKEFQEIEQAILKAFQKIKLI